MMGTIKDPMHFTSTAAPAIGRYAISTKGGEYPTILLDTVTGLTWAATETKWVPLSGGPAAAELETT